MLVYLGQKNDTHSLTLALTHSRTHANKHSLSHTHALSQREEKDFLRVCEIRVNRAFFISILLEVFLETATQEKLET